MSTEEHLLNQSESEYGDINIQSKKHMQINGRIKYANKNKKIEEYIS